VSHLTPLDGNYQAAMQGLSQTFVQRGADTVQAAHQAQGMLYGLLQQQATMRAFVDVFWVLGVVFLCVIPLVFLMRKVQPHKAPVMVE
jgi:DHA2 family multidrug resistance protein